MVLDASAVVAGLTVLEGGRKPDRRSADEEARMEAIALAVEVIDFAARITRRAEAARLELLRLGTPEGAA